MIKNRFIVLLIFVIFLVGLSVVSANENITDVSDVINDDEVILEDPESLNQDSSDDLINDSQANLKTNSKIETHDVTGYYKDNLEFVSYLKDGNNQPISNKKVSILINSKSYDKTTDATGKIVLKINLKPGSYTTTVKFDGDENYTSSVAKAIVKVNKASLSIQTKNFKTYFESGFYFKAKVINNITKNSVKNIKVAFKVYHNNKYKVYYATTDANGVAHLKKNFRAGSYKVVVNVKDNNVKVKKSKAAMTIKETAETGCSSLYVQVNKYKAVIGFRRDATNTKTIHIVKDKLNGVPVIKQYKKNSYFFHIIVAANGWMAGTGGADNPTINHAIEKLVGKMFKAGKIKKSYLKKIQGYERQLGIGHFSIKAPNGKYALVWSSGIKWGKLKPGQYIDVPNARSMFRHGAWDKFSKDPAKAAIKIAATDKFGVNRRDATAFLWKATTIDGKTTAKLKAYGANDNGKLAGRSTGHLRDDIYFKGTFFSKNNLPKTPSKLLLGVHNFGSIDKMIKTQTTVKAPKLTKLLNESKKFTITVKNKKTKKPVKKLKLKLKIKNKVYTVKTNSKGVASFNPKALNIGSYNVLIYSGNIKYYVSSKSTIKIVNCTS